MTKQNSADSRPRIVVSEALPDGRIVEMIYDEKERKTKLAVYGNGEVLLMEELELLHPTKETIIPPSAKNELISKKIILFPSAAEPYGEDRELVERIQEFVHRYLDVSPLFERLASYYVMFTWAYDHFSELAYLRALGDFGSGKSRCLQVIGSMCYKPMFTSGATTVSPIFRIIDQFRGTLILDEADFRFSDTTADIIKILNSGYQKGMPVLRVEGDEKRRIVKAYDVFCPKIIGTRERFYDTALESRFLIEEMEKKALRHDIPINLPLTFWDEARALRNQLLMWRFENFYKVKLKPEVFDSKLEPRLNQIVMPLLSIIDDEALKEELKAFIREYNDQLVVDRGMGQEVEVLISLLGIYRRNNFEPTVKVVAEIYNKFLTEREQLQYRKVGSILRNKLKLKTHRTARGIVIPEVENRKKIESLVMKYGISQSEIEHADLNISDETESE